MNPPTPTSPRPARGIGFRLAALALVVVSALAATGAATGLARWLKESRTQKPPEKAVSFPGKAFARWKKPDFVLVLTGQQQGYLLPCGCSSPQVGGLARRYNLLKALDEAGWPYAAIDLGDVAQKEGPAGLPNQQAMIKYTYSMRAHKAMGYSAMGFAAHEVNLGLFNVLGEYALNEKEPRIVATNLMEAEKNFPEMTAPWQPIDLDAVKVRLGVVSITGPAYAAKFKEMTRNDPKLRFADSKVTLDGVLKQFDANQVALPILLWQGPVTRNEKETATEALAVAKAYPQFPIVVCHTDDDIPPSRPREVPGTKSWIITLGQKGKFVGVVGVYGKKPPFTFAYERVEMTEDFETPEAKKKANPVVALLEEYTKDLRDKKYLEQYGQVRHALQMLPEVKGLRNPGEVEYVGSEACKKCHEHAYEVWKKSGHSHAYKTLVDAKNPGNRHFDPECIVCHTVGFGTKSGYVSEADWAKRKAATKPGEKDPPILRDVGCESCHGPASLHVKNPNNEDWQKRINPWPYIKDKKKRVNALDQMCQKCHDQENDVHWLNGGFERKWPKVAHPTPGVQRGDPDEDDKPKDEKPKDKK